MHNDKSEYTPESISALVSQFRHIRILLTAYELNIFSILESEPSSSDKVAEKIKADPRATNRLLNALCVVGLLEKRDGKFTNTPGAQKYLVRGKPGYMAGLMHQVHLWDTWTTLTDCVKKGSSVYNRPEKVNDRDSDWLHAFINAMHWRAKDNAITAIEKINLEGVKKVLDVGGGSGVYSMAFVNAGKNITATVFDLSNVIPITKEYIRKEKMSGKIDTAIGDYETDALPAGYDIVFLSAIVHSNSVDGNLDLIRKCTAALNPGGRVIIKDQIMDESRLNPARGALFSLNMLVGTKAGDTYTENEMKDWIEKAGLQLEERIDVPGDDSMVIGRK